MEKKVVYLTGAPAAGKTSVCEGLRERVSDLVIFEYGKKMAARLGEKLASAESSRQERLRAGTYEHVNQVDIEAVNSEMEEFCRQHRRSKHVIIDSHHVTKEDFGFRLSPFSMTTLSRLDLSEIWVIIVSAAETIARIRNQPAGRPAPNEFEANFHTFIQASLAASYSLVEGTPTYFFEGEGLKAALVDQLTRRLAAEGS